MAKHPTQPIEIVNGVRRFKENMIVRTVLDFCTLDLNALSKLPFDIEDRKQFYQLIGYSVDGYNDIFDSMEEDEDK